MQQVRARRTLVRRFSRRSRYLVDTAVLARASQALMNACAGFWAIAVRPFGVLRVLGHSPVSGSSVSSLPNGDQSLLPVQPPASSSRPRLRDRLKAPLEPVLRLPVPLLLAGLVVAGSTAYFFGLGRNRYTAESSFIVRLPQAAAPVSSTLLGATLAGPTMLGSLEDGRFLAVYLTSPEVMRRVFLRLQPEVAWGKRLPDPFAGLSGDVNAGQMLAFFRRQVFVVPQDLTGVINLTTVGLEPEASYRLNQLLLEEAEVFLNRVNQNISLNQQRFSEQEVGRARQRLDKANAALNAFKNKHGEINPSQSALATNNYINSLESKLVDLKVEEASLKRQFKDHDSPEVAFVTDQVRELERQISEERRLLVNPQGKDFNRLVAESSRLETEVTLATEALSASIKAADSNRQSSLNQVKFLVRLADPQLPQDQNLNWRWQGQLAVIGSLVVIWGLGSFALGIVTRR